MLDYEANIKPFKDAGLNYLVTFGGSALPFAAYDNRDALADQILAWVLKYNLTGIHNDWEVHSDDGVDAYRFYDFWGTVASKLHQHNRMIGTCVETAPANVSHPWAPRTQNNDSEPPQAFRSLFPHSYLLLLTL